MRIFYAFLIAVISAILFMLPVAEAVYDFRTATRTDEYSIPTALAQTTANETLWDDLYNSDLGSVSIASSVATDVPLPSSYNATTRVLLTSGLTANTTTRILEITFDYDSLQGSGAINTLMDRVSWIWMIVIIAFAPAALFAIFTGRV